MRCNVFSSYFFLDDAEDSLDDNPVSQREQTNENILFDNINVLYLEHV